MIGSYELLKCHCQMKPNKTALICGEERFTYGELGREIDRLAWGMQTHGIDTGSRVALLFRNRAIAVECMFALWKLGACAVPVNFRETAENMATVMRIAEISYMICADDYVETAVKAVELSGQKICLVRENKAAGAISLEEMKENLHENWERPSADGQTEELYIFTSGTTGTPKVAVHTKERLALFTWCCNMRGGLYYEDDVFLSYSPLCHIGGIRILLGCLTCGATLILSDSFRPENILHLIVSEKVTQMLLIPPEIIFRLQELDGYDAAELSSVRQIRISGGICDEKAVALLFELFPNATLISGYGSSESMVSMYNTFTKPEFERDPKLCHSIGRPMPLNEVRLIDKEGNLIQEPHVVGEAYGGCPYMFEKYLTETGTVFPESLQPTGDLMCTDEQGNYYFRGRLKDIIKTKGENVFAGEVESVLRLHPAVAECAVFGMFQDATSEAVAAAVVLKSEGSADEAALISFCKEHLASYKKPVRVFFVRDLPKTASGKVRKFVLKQLAETGQL